MGEAMEIVLNQRVICSVWRWESACGGWWSIDMYQATDAIGLAADMLDGLEEPLTSLRKTQYYRQWNHVMAYVNRMIEKHAKPKRC